MINPHKKYIIFCVIAGLIYLPLFPACGYGEETGYDRYAPVYKEGTPLPPSSRLKEWGSKLLVFPFALVRVPVDKTLMMIEKHHIDKKIQWIYDQIQNQGITPKASVISIGNLGGGAEVDLMRLARIKGDYPDAIWESWYQWTNNVYMETGTRFGWERIGGTGFRTYGRLNYEKRPEEHFYGIGPDTSAGEGTSYKMEATTIEAKAGYDAHYGISGDLIFAYKNVNITEGDDKGRGQIDPVFFPEVIPGLSGDELITLGVELVHDSRDQKENSTQGGMERLSFSYNEGVDGSKAGYFKLEAEASRFFRLRSPRRVLALHVYGEHNAEGGASEVPFHQMAKLGGFGAHPRLSHTLRGFDFNRFFDESAILFNIEYRYTIWEYKEWKMDTVFFWDEGQVFGEFENLQFSDFRESYGLGARVSLADHVVLSIETAHGDEGTNFYVKSSLPF